MNLLLPWQQQNWQHLHDYISQKRIPQALLISGKKGVGKQQLAEQFAFTLLCTERQTSGLACGHCHSCLLLKAQTHPDFIFVAPEEIGKVISIGQIRKLITQLSLKPQYNAYRVVIINPAEQMNNAAANAFLKGLEEPGERTVILLVTDKPGKLTATIRSRCQKLLVTTPEKSVVFSWFKQQNINEHHELLFSLAQGAPLLAKQYAHDNTLQTRADCLKAWLSVAKQQSDPVLVAETWHKLPDTSLLFWMTSWLIDIIKCAYQAKTENSYNPDAYQTLKELALKLDLKNVYNLYDLLLVSRQRIDTQINKQTLFEEILIQWADINRSN